MRKNNNLQRSKLKGYLFEIAVSKLLSENDYISIENEVENRIRVDRDGFVEFKGRGGWHQIDCPFDYGNNIPFVNPIRLLVEIKCYQKRIQKDQIREYIGVIKDIQENYIVETHQDIFSNRYNEIGVFVSASGFSKEAEMLAFAHNIKTISYENVELIRSIVDQIEYLEANYFDTSLCISRGNQVEFLRWFKGVVIEGRETEGAYERYELPEGIDNEISVLRENINAVRSHFFANTNAGAFLHFISDELFPDELFYELDTQVTRIHFQTDTRGRRRFWLQFSRDERRRRFYFTPPENLDMAAFWGGRRVLDEKERMFRELTLIRRIAGIKRTLTLQLDREWFDSHYRHAELEV
ncbi:restriction endonuclease [Vibrio parahaemolyticus]|uniref:Restriction endonuclease n=5 Tax=Vibrio parahaemolyticus TaxID=670 RepID=A0A9Q3YKG9_VIBPH|nr:MULTISPECIES: restriction endonuclease [Vibrio]EGQ7800620.1 restriction endonuclease [Vibrio parahaemolyticus]EGQ8200676.1 restriction endonuclease [Vibrio parahaemolyticus]EGQ9075088.1 hypothetical protein [Vibrio parahaemolyticus]EGU0150475.1 restriction endonuclease [Vibrio parahaemolyticus]EHA6962269.1 restriction endonuclease [Vibrio parahaemolyticus]